MKKNIYWVDDSESQYYNKMVKIVTKKINTKDYIEIKKEQIDWKTAEDLFEFKTEYTYAIEIKYNENNEKYKGSGIFLHCSSNKATQGCIAIPEKDIKIILNNLEVKNQILIY